MKRKPKTSNKIKRAPQGRSSPHPLFRLQNALDVYEYTAAYEILATNRMIDGPALSRDEDFDDPVKAIRYDGADDHAAKRTDLVKVFPQWQTDLKGTIPLQVTLAVLLSEMTLTDIDADNHWRKGTARQHLAVGLKHFAHLRAPRATPREWKFTPPTPPAKKDKAA